MGVAFDIAGRHILPGKCDIGKDTQFLHYIFVSTEFLTKKILVVLALSSMYQRLKKNCFSLKVDSRAGAVLNSQEHKLLLRRTQVSKCPC